MFQRFPRFHWSTLTGAALLAISFSSLSEGNERHFTYTYESAVLAPGAREFELWTTYKTGRHDFYREMEHRAEFEVGLTNKLQTSFYLNWTKTSELDTAAVEPNTIKSETEFEGVSSEWKYKMTDPVANKIGSALYLEAMVGTEELELETKLILDKRLGSNLIAYNLVGEVEWEQEPGEVEYEATTMEHDLGFTHFFSDRMGAGLEVQSLTQFNNDHSPQYSALFLGPTVSYTTDNWWVAFTALAQLPAIKRSPSDPDSALILEDHERYNARLLISFRL